MSNNTLDELMDKARGAYSDAAAPGGAWAQFEAEARAMMAAHYPELWASLGVGDVAFFDHLNTIVFFQTAWPELYVRWDDDSLDLCDKKRLGMQSVCVWDNNAGGGDQTEVDDIGLFLLDAHVLRGGTWE